MYPLAVFALLICIVIPVVVCTAFLALLGILGAGLGWLMGLTAHEAFAAEADPWSKLLWGLGGVCVGIAGAFCFALIPLALFAYSYAPVLRG